MTQPPAPTTERDKAVAAFVAWFATPQGFMGMYEHHYARLFVKAGKQLGLSTQAYEETETLRTLWGLPRAYLGREVFNNKLSQHRKRKT